VTVHLLAIWIAMCCCQWRAGAGCLGMTAMPSCCAPVPAADDCCHNCCDEEAPTPAPVDTDACADCCTKAPSPQCDELPASLFVFHLDHLGTLVLHLPSIALPATDLSIERGTVWHPPPGRFRPLVCILTV